MRKLVLLSKCLAISLFLTAFISPVAHGVGTCPPSKSDGKTVGIIQVEKVRVNIKNVDYPEGQELIPPKSPLNAGVSIRHQPLSAQSGSTIIVWHVNYNGCQGKLNVVNNKKVGFKFKVTDEQGKTLTYEIAKKLKVKKGNYDPDWFMLSGPRQLVLVTCTGRVVNRSYTDNLVIIATPISES